MARPNRCRQGTDKGDIGMICFYAECLERKNDSLKKLDRYTPAQTSYKECLLKFIAVHLVEILFELRMFRHNIDK